MCDRKMRAKSLAKRRQAENVYNAVRYRGVAAYDSQPHDAGAFDLMQMQRQVQINLVHTFLGGKKSKKSYRSLFLRKSTLMVGFQLTYL